MNTLISGLVLSFITLVPVGLKWELEKKIVIPAAFLIGTMSWILVHVTTTFWNLTFFQIVIYQVFLIGVISISLLLWRFFRDPERIPPDNENAILSPADGRIIYVKKIENGEVPLSEKNGRKFPLNDFVQSDVLPSGGHLIGILLTYLDVHVN